MAEIRLPLFALELADACELGRRVADFAAHHGHPPGEDSTWAEWCAVTPELGDRVWAVAHALPLVYPTRRDHLIRVVVEVAYRASVREAADLAIDRGDLVRQLQDLDELLARLRLEVCNG